MGFRGEALASIGEVSHLILRSKTPGEAAGAQIEVRGGKTSDVEPCGCPTGTAIEVRDLFFNTPVRRKFMRSTQTEFGHISEAFARIAMANPEIHCVLRHNNREVHDLPAGKGLLDRIAGLFGRDIAEHLIWVESQNGSARLSGYVAHPKISRSNARMQYLFLNGRYIRDRSLQHALREAYRGLLTVGRQPIAFLVLEIPLEDVDVNVHPTKLEVRFQDSGRLYSQLLATLRTAFLGSNLNTRVDASAQSGPMTEEAEGGARSELLDWAKCELSSPGPAGADRPSAPAANRPDQSQMDFGVPPIRAVALGIQYDPARRVFGRYDPACRAACLGVARNRAADGSRLPFQVSRSANPQSVSDYGERGRGAGYRSACATRAGSV